VFDIIAESAVRLCGAETSTVTRFDGEWVRLVAVYGSSPEGVDAVRRSYPLRGGGASAAARSIRDRAISHIPDVLVDEEYGVQEAAVASGFRAALAVPMLRGGRAIGAIAIGRSEPGEFSERQVELLRTFADQALIAIENVRLFAELQEKNRALTVAHAQVTEGLEQQTATSEILRVIASSPTAEQPVFDAIVRSSRRLCDAAFSVVVLTETGEQTLVAIDGVDATKIPALQGIYPRPIARDTTTGRAILDRRVIHIEDSLLDPEYTHPLRDSFTLRSILTVPFFRDGVPLGAVSVWRGEARPFTDKQIALLKTFADQAVIAIENVRLFNELGARNRELSESLEQQTATAEILRVISSSPTDLQPVFDAIAERAMQLCGASSSGVLRFDGELVHIVALGNVNPDGAAALRSAFPMPPNPRSASTRAILTRSIVHIADVLDDPDYGIATQAQAGGFRSILSVPMLREGKAIGGVTVGRPNPGQFSESQIALLEIFADQAVIAIDNVRLFTELQTTNRNLTTALDTQTATSDILHVIRPLADGCPAGVRHDRQKRRKIVRRTLQRALSVRWRADLSGRPAQLQPRRA
jgi:two-component system, NtrC family, sensor kinase